MGSVSRALNGHAGVSTEVSARVSAAAAQLRYRPNAIARSLRTESTATIGLVISNVMNPFFTDLARAVEDEALRHGFSVIFGNSDEDPIKETRYLEVLHDKRVDGLLLAPSGGLTTEIMRLKDSGVPMVLIDRNLPRSGLPYARVDGAGAIHQLVEHLHKLGYRRAGVIAGPEGLLPGRERLAAFLQSAERLGIEVDPAHIVSGDFKENGGAQAICQLLDRAPLPEVVFVCNNLMTLGALGVLAERGLSIPDDVAMASFDDTPWFAVTDPPLTVVAQPTVKLGQIAARLLIELMSGKEVRSRCLQAELRVRASCGERAQRP